jgi:hypothetical protein
MLCGCKSCRPVNEAQEFKLEVMKGNEIQCPYCGFSEDLNWWLDLEWERNREKREKEA